jgi:TP901 family phage tail tape measure protein
VRRVIDVKADEMIAREQARTAAAVAKSQADIQRSMQRTGQEKDKLGRNFRSFGGGATQVMAGLRQAFQKTFQGTGGILNLGARLFAPAGRVVAGFDDLSRAAKGLFGLLTLNPFRAAAAGFTVLGDAVGGLSKIFAGLTSQAFRFVAMPARVLSAFTRIIPGIGQAVSLMSGLVGGAISFIGDSIGEIAQLFGRAFGGLANIAAKALTPVAKAFDFLVSPITQVFRIIQFAWQNSLLIMGGAAAMFTKSAVSTFMDFEKRISEALSQIPGAGQRQFGQFQELALGLSRSLGRSAREIADSLKLATSVGFADLEAAGKIVEAATRFSTAGFASVETATRALTNTINSFGLSADDAAGVTDKLFRGFQVAGGSLEFFSEGLGVIASSVNAAGGSMDDLIATTALLSRAAAGNSRIFIETQQLFQRMVSPTDSARAAMDQMGIAIARNRAGGVDFFETLAAMQERIRELSGGDTIRAFQLLRKIFPEERAARAFSKLMSANADSIREVRNAMAGARGSVAGALGQVDERAFRQLEKLKAAWERLRIVAGGALARFLSPLWTKLADVIQAVEERVSRLAQNKGFDRLAASFQRLVAAFGISLPAGQTVADYVERLIRQDVPALLDKIATAVERVREAIAGIDLQAVLDTIDHLRQRGVETFISLGKAGIEFARPVLTTLTAVADVMMGLFDLAKGLGQTFAAAGNVASAAWRAMISIVTRAWTMLLKMTRGGIDTLARAAEFAASFGIPGAKSASKGLRKVSAGMEPQIAAVEGFSKALGELATADMDQATAQGQAALESFSKGFGRLADVFAGKTQTPKWLDTFASRLDSISRDFGAGFIDKLKGQVGGKAVVADRQRPSTLDAIRGLAKPRRAPNTLESVAKLSGLSLDDLAQREIARNPLMRMPPAQAWQILRGRASRRALTPTEQTIYDQLRRAKRIGFDSPDLMPPAGPVMRGFGGRLQDLPVRQPPAGQPPLVPPTMRGGGSLLDLQPRGPSPVSPDGGLSATGGQWSPSTTWPPSPDIPRDAVDVLQLSDATRLTTTSTVALVSEVLKRIAANQELQHDDLQRLKAQMQLVMMA